MPPIRSLYRSSQVSALDSRSDLEVCIEFLPRYLGMIVERN